MPGVISEPLKGCSKRESVSPRSRIAEAFSLWAISSIQAILLKYSSDCWKFSFDTVSLTGKLTQEAIIRYGTPTIFNTDIRVPDHQPGVHGAPEAPRHPDQHGRERMLAGQCIRGATRDKHYVEAVYLLAPELSCADGLGLDVT